MFKKVLMISALTIAIMLMATGKGGYSNNVSVSDSGGTGNIWVVPKSMTLPNTSVADSGGTGNIWVVPKSMTLPNTSVADLEGSKDICVVPRTI